MPSPSRADSGTATTSAAEIFDDDFVLSQLLKHTVRVGRLQIDLVHRNDDRHASRLGVSDGLHCLRHNPVIGGNHDHRRCP